MVEPSKGGSAPAPASGGRSRSRGRRGVCDRRPGTRVIALLNRSRNNRSNRWNNSITSQTVEPGKNPE
uniref:Uncharacterized protein n=1 Tax=Oryza glumipatula TaxID=40148 RepID=A0A0D9Y3R2_9ORYZ